MRGDGEMEWRGRECENRVKGAGDPVCGEGRAGGGAAGRQAAIMHRYSSSLITVIY